MEVIDAPADASMAPDETGIGVPLDGAFDLAQVNGLPQPDRANVAVDGHRHVVGGRKGIHFIERGVVG